MEEQNWREEGSRPCIQSESRLGSGGAGGGVLPAMFVVFLLLFMIVLHFLLHSFVCHHSWCYHVRSQWIHRIHVRGGWWRYVGRGRDLRVGILKTLVVAQGNRAHQGEKLDSLGVLLGSGKGLEER